MLFCFEQKIRFFGNRKIAFSWNTEKIAFLAASKSDFSHTEKIPFRGALKKRFFGNRKNGFFVAHWKSNFPEQKKNDFWWRPEKPIYRKNRFFMAPWKSDIPYTGKTFSWRLEKAFFRIQKKSISHGALKKRFFGYAKNLFFMAPWKSDFSDIVALWKRDLSENEKMPFSWRPEKALFRRQKK